ncbi:MAG: hypothetical protein HZY76_14590 [Anaerolineae bacterium]|nr:MAG: hypothetical protein HZY76_14590 [Anaerolineae bacterium]
MWRRNQAGTLIELGRLDEAAAAIEQARALEPEAPRLAQLAAQLAAARERRDRRGMKFPGYKTAPVETGWRACAATSFVTTSLETHTRSSADKPR